MIRLLYEKLTGRPWTTTRSMSAEYGPPPGAIYATQLASYSDLELIHHGEHILAQLHAQEPAHHHTTTSPVAASTVTAPEFPYSTTHASRYE